MARTEEELPKGTKKHSEVTSAKKNLALALRGKDSIGEKGLYWVNIVWIG